jgi:hypothetical protein
MKTLNFFIMMLMIISASTQAVWAQKKSTEKKAEVKQKSISVPLASQISLSDALRWTKNYRTSNTGLLGRPRCEDGQFEQVDNTRSVWFSIDQMKRIVEKIEAEGGDGMRIYFAKYDTMEIPGLGGPNRCYTFQNTLIMVSTEANNNFHFDYFEDRASKKEARGFIINMMKMVPENKGEICPPPTNCKDIGALLEVED